MTDRQALINGVPFVTLQAELNSQDQGGDRILLPIGGPQDLVVVVEAIWVWYQTVPSQQHAYTFFKTGVALSTTVTITTSGSSPKFTVVRLTTPEYFNCLVDNWSVRHDTNAQNGNETAAAHAAEGGRIWAGLVPTRYE